MPSKIPASRPEIRSGFLTPAKGLLRIARGSSHKNTGYPAQAPARVIKAAYFPMAGQEDHDLVREGPRWATPSRISPVGQIKRQNQRRRRQQATAKRIPIPAARPTVRVAILEPIASSGL